MAIENVLLVGTQAAYAGLTPDAGKLYFCSDTRNIYKGTDLYTDGIRAVTTDPDVPAVGKLYYNSSEDVLKFYDGTSWTTVRVAMATTVSTASTDDQIPTALAVYNYVTEQIEATVSEGNVVQSVTAGDDDGTLNVTTAGVAGTVTVPGVVTTPSYDATTRTITLPVSTGDDLVIELGKDIFIDTSASNGYDATTQEVVLYLNDGTEIRIPASGLVDVYTGDTTTSATVSVSDANVITAQVILSTDANNILQVDATNGGLLVDVSAYATLRDLQDAVDSIDDAAAELAAKVQTNTDAIALLNGDSTTSGSVAYAVAQLKETLEAEITENKEAIETNAENIATLQADVLEIQNAWGFTGMTVETVIG